MNNIPFPSVPKSKEIDERAKEIFLLQRPSNWLLLDIDGNKDFGLDFLVQFKEESFIKYNFFLQLKGIQSQNKITTTDIQTQIKVSTLNYYRNNGLVVLVFCDVNEEKCYYEFLHIILNNLNENKRYLDDSQKTYLIKVPKNQLLDKTLIINNELECYANGVYDVHRQLSIIDEYKIEDLFIDNEENYKPYKSIYNGHYVNQKGRVHLDSFIPHNFSFNISCMITFKLSDSKNVLITPKKNIILKTLFSGYKSKATSSSRKWLVGHYDNSFIIQIGDARLSVPLQVVIDLSDMLDELFEIYTAKIDEFETKLKSKLFSTSSVYNEGFKIMKIKRGLWYYIHKFAEKHTYDNKSESEWNIFGYDRFCLRVHLKEKPFLWSGNIILMPERYTDYTNYKNDDDEVVLTWNSLPPETYERKDNIDNILSVNEVYKWLTTKLIPYIIYDLEKEKLVPYYKQEKVAFLKIFKLTKTISSMKKPTFEEFLKVFDIKKYVIFDYYEKYSTGNKLLDTVNDLQSFYIVQRDIFIDITKLISLYDGLCLLFKKNKNSSNLNYLRGNLNDLIIDGELTSEKFIKGIKKKIKSLNSGTVNEFRLDLILRCYIVLVEDNIDVLDEDLINQIQNKLKDVIKHTNLLKVCERELLRVNE